LLEKDKNIDDLFAYHLSDYEEKAPAYVWKNIQADIKLGKAKKRLTIIRAMAASLALLLAFGLGYYFSDFSENKMISKNEKTITKKSLTTNTIDNTTEAAESKYLALNYEQLPTISKQEKSNIVNSLIYKLFNKDQDIYSITGQAHKNNYSLRIENKKHAEKRSSNQLLIDTLFFRKENLPEGGFLSSKSKNNHSKWSLGTKFSPVYSLAENSEQPNGDLNSPIAKSVSENKTPDIKADEKSLMSFSGGINVNYQFTRRWSIESGLFYSQYRQMAENLKGSSFYGLQDDMSVYTPEGIRSVQQGGIGETGTSSVIGKSMDQTYYSLSLDYRSNYEYLELPLIVRYRVIDRKLGLDVFSGITTNFLVGNKSSIIYNDNDLWTGTTDGISPMLYNATIGLGVNYDLFHNLSFNIEPTFKYSITTDESTSLIKYPYRIAIFAGFSYRF